MTEILVNVGCGLIGVAVGLWAHPTFSALLAKLSKAKDDVKNDF